MSHLRAGKGTVALVEQAKRGELDLSEWDDEELLQGRRRDRKGRFSGKRPSIIPASLHQELWKRKTSEVSKLLVTNVLEATNVLINLATNENVDDGVRLNAAKFLFERVMGKTPEKIEVEVEAPWMVALRGAIVSVPHDQDDTIDVDPWEDDKPRAIDRRGGLRRA